MFACDRTSARARDPNQNVVGWQHPREELSAAIERLARLQRILITRIDLLYFDVIFVRLNQATTTLVSSFL
jgi:hypothetical protein